MSKKESYTQLILSLLIHHNNSKSLLAINNKIVLSGCRIEDILNKINRFGASISVRSGR